MKTAKKGLVDVALNVGGKSGTSGTVTIGSTPKNEKGLFDLSLDIGREPRDGAEENQDQTDTTRGKGRFALSLGLLPSVAGGLMNIGIDVRGGKNNKGRREQRRRARKNGSAKTEKSAPK